MITNPSEAADIIRSGNLVAIPTETVYGLAADAFNIQAVLKTFELKGRPADNPLIIHINSIDQLKRIAVNIPESVALLAKAFWPGPLTLILNKQKDVPDIVTGGLSTVAVRMPDHPLTLEMIRLSGPVTAPSANRSGSPSPTRAEHVKNDHSDLVPILDGGNCRIGIESTVLDLTGAKPVILRPGAISADMIMEKTGINVSVLNKTDIKMQMKSPGTRYTHYKPIAQVEWFDPETHQTESDSYYLLHTYPEYQPLPNLFHYKGDFNSMARDLYDHFRTADHLGYTHIKIEPLPDSSKDPLIPALTDRISKSVGR